MSDPAEKHATHLKFKSPSPWVQRFAPLVPTAGPSSGAMLDLAAGGTAVICISQDLDELLEVSDNFAALNEGRLSNVRTTRDLTMETIGLMLGGAHDMHDLDEEAIHAEA